MCDRLGTTQKAAGTPAQFEKIDREYVIAAAKAAKSDDPSHEQRLVYCSVRSLHASSAQVTSYLLTNTIPGVLP